MISKFVVKFVSIIGLFVATALLLKNGSLSAMEKKDSFEFSSISNALCMIEQNIPEQNFKMFRLQKYLKAESIERLSIKVPEYIASKIFNVTKDRNFGAVIAFIPMEWGLDNKEVIKYLKKAVKSFHETRSDFYFCHGYGNSFSTRAILVQRLDNIKIQIESGILNVTKNFLCNENLALKACYLIKISKTKPLNTKRKHPGEQEEKKFKRLKLT